MDGTGEMTISLKDLLYRILLRWRLILVCLVAGAVLFGAVGYMKNVRAAKMTIVPEPLTTAEVIEKYESELTDNEVAVVQAAVESYSGYEKSRGILEEYLSSSMRMQFDPNRIPILKLQYLVDSHYEAVYPVVAAKDYTADILASYIAKLTDASVYEEMAEIFGVECDSSYMRELIFAEGNADTLTVSIYGLTEEDCRAISPIIQKAIRESTGELQRTYGDFDLTLVQESYYENVNPELLTEQRQRRDEYNNLVNNMNNLSSNMTDVQKEYYNALLADTKEEEADSADHSQPEANPSDSVHVNLFHKKYILLGAVAGVFLACCYLACRYLLSTKLRVKEDLEECFGIANLGVLPAAQKEKKILSVVDHWIVSVFGEKNGNFSEEERVRMICAGIRIGAKKADMNSIYLTGVCNDGDCEQAKAMLCDRMKQDVESVGYGASVVYDPESLEAMVAADGVVFVERIDGSRYDELRKEAEICRQNQIKIIGSVILS